MKVGKQRRLLAVMFTDVVGYAALTQSDEEAASAARRRHRQAVEAAAGIHGGDVLQFSGDGSLTTFPSVLSSVRAALDIQLALRSEPAVPLRAGIHRGEISYDTQGMFGDGVNVASLIQALGAPGSILVSATAYDEIKNQAEISATSLGTFELKNVADPLEVYAVTGHGLVVPTVEKTHDPIRARAEPPQEELARLNAALAGRYGVEREVGFGGMATVYLASDLRHDRRVALKVLKRELAAVLGAGRFLAEIKTTANLQHPHILPLFDSGEADGFLFYVMPFVEGQSLRERLDREPQLPVDEAVRIACAVGSALDYAHRRGIVHRDIKPANILMQDGQPVVADFGIALAIGAASGGRITTTGVNLGTPQYMSPEQASGDHGVGAASDIYSLGCVLYEMLTGDPPFVGRTTQGILGQVLAIEPTPAAKRRTSVPPHVDAAITRSLAKLPADRFLTVSSFVDALEDPRFDVGRGTAPVQPARRVGTGRRIGWSVLAAAAVGLAVAMGVVLGRDAPPRTVAAYTLDTGNLEVLDNISVSRDGRMFATSAADPSGIFRLWVRRVDEPDFRPLPGTEGARYAAFSPDGNWIAYRSDPTNALLKISVAGGGPITVFDVDSIPPHLPDWGDGDVIVFGNFRGTWRVSASGEETARPVGVRLGPPTGSSHPRVVPGGRGAILTSQGSLYYVDFETDSATLLLRDAVRGTYVSTGHLIYLGPQGGLFAVPFDLKGLRVTGTPVLVRGDVVERYAGSYEVSEEGTLTFRDRTPAGAAEQRMVFIDRSGMRDTVRMAPRYMDDPRISPDGGSVVFITSGGQLQLVDLVTGSAPELTSDGNNWNPVWSPDGRQIVFASVRPGTAGADILALTLGVDRAPEPILSAEGWQAPSAWSVDDIIAYVDLSRSQPDLMRLARETGEVRPYVRTDLDEADLALTRDGRWAAYVSNETGQDEVYVRGFPDPVGKWQISTGGGGEPRWSPRGDELYYWKTSPGPDSLMAVPVQSSSTFRAGSPSFVVAVERTVDSGWDVHPDGRFLVLEDIGVPSDGDRLGDRYVVVLNFFEQLKRLTAR